MGERLRRAEQAAAEYAARAEIARAELVSGRIPLADRDARMARLAGYEQLAAGLVARRGIDPEPIAAPDRDDTLARARATQARAAEEQRRRDQAARRRQEQGEPEAATRLVGDQRDPAYVQREDQSECDRQARADRIEQLRQTARAQRAQHDRPQHREPVTAQAQPCAGSHPQAHRDGQVPTARSADQPGRSETGTPPTRQVRQAQERDARDRQRLVEPDRIAPDDLVEQQARTIARGPRRAPVHRTVQEPGRDSSQEDAAQVGIQRAARMADRVLAGRAAKEAGSGTSRKDGPDHADQVDKAQRAIAEVRRRQAERAAAEADQQRRASARAVQQQQQATRKGPTLSR